MSALWESCRRTQPDGIRYVVAIYRTPGMHRFEFERSTPSLTVNDWIPSEPPNTSVLFMDRIDRSADPVRLAGHRVDMSGCPIEDGIDEGYWTIDREGGAADEVWFTPAWRDRLPGMVRTRDCKWGPGRDLRVGFTDEIPEGDCLMVQSDTWRAIEWPVTGERNLVCMAPGYNARVRVEPPPMHWSRK